MGAHAQIDIGGACRLDAFLAVGHALLEVLEGSHGGSTDTRQLPFSHEVEACHRQLGLESSHLDDGIRDVELRFDERTVCIDHLACRPDAGTGVGG